MTLLTLFELSSIVLVVGEAVVVFFFRDSASLVKVSLLAFSSPSVLGRWLLQWQYGGSQSQIFSL